MSTEQTSDNTKENKKESTKDMLKGKLDGAKESLSEVKDKLTEAANKLLSSNKFTRTLSGGPNVYDSSTPNTTATANLESVENGDYALANLSCQILISCETAKQIKDAVSKMLDDANTTYTESVKFAEQLNASKSGDVAANTKAVQAFAQTTKKASDTYKATLSKQITFSSPLSCKVAVKNAVNAQNVTTTHFDGTITGMLPAEKKVVISFVTYKSSKKAPIPVKVDKQAISITKVCVDPSDPKASS